MFGRNETVREVLYRLETLVGRNRRLARQKGLLVMERRTLKKVIGELAKAAGINDVTEHTSVPVLKARFLNRKHH